MRPSATVIVGFVILAGLTVWITRQAKTLEQDLDSGARTVSVLDKPAPDFHGTSLDGRAVSLADYRGKKKLVLAFLAGWNNASHTDMMMLRAIYLGNRQPDADFDVVGISLDDDRAAAQNFVNESKPPFPVLFDQGRAITDAYQIRSLPTLLLIDTDGKVTYGAAGINQRGQNELFQRIGISNREIRMQMGRPSGGRGN